MPTVSLIYIDVNRKCMTGRNMTVHNKGWIEKCAVPAEDTIVWRMRPCAVAPGSVLPSSVSVRSVGKTWRAAKPKAAGNDKELMWLKCDTKLHHKSGLIGFAWIWITYIFMISLSLSLYVYIYSPYIHL